MLMLCAKSSGRGKVEALGKAQGKKCLSLLERGSGWQERHRS